MIRQLYLGLLKRGSVLVSRPSTSLRLMHRCLATQSFAARGMFIQVQETPNPLTLKFHPGRPVLGKGKGTLDFESLTSAKKSPLAMQLLRINGIKSVFFGEDYVTVTRVSESDDWALLKPEIFAILMDYLQAEKAIVNEGDMPEGPEDTMIHPDDDDTVAMLKELIECRVKPMVQEDGGDVLFRGYRDGVVYLKLQGSCTGCPSSSVTLQSGIKNMLQFYVPEVKDVVEEKDEADAVNEEAYDELVQKIRTKPNPNPR